MLSSLENEEFAVSKYECGVWAQKAYPAWSEAIDAAIRTYCGTATGDDRAVLDATLPLVLESVSAALREHLGADFDRIRRRVRLR